MIDLLELTRLKYCFPFVRVIKKKKFVRHLPNIGTNPHVPKHRKYVIFLMGPDEPSIAEC
jgi:hypothetical protein